ncbi:MAG: hypothetical protein ACOH2G_19290 [Ewingella sp.]
MNKYDDIKRFIEKTKTEDIDYKEINKKNTGNGMTGSMNKWALIKQVSASEEAPGILENGRTTQSTPQAISAAEFQRSTPAPYDLLNTPVSAHSAIPQVPTPLNTLSSSTPPGGGGLMEALRESLPVTSKPQPLPQASVQHSTAMLHAQSVTPDSVGSLLDAVKNALPARSMPAAQPATTSASVRSVMAATSTHPAVTNAHAAATPAPSGQFRQMFKQKAPPSAAALLHRDTPLQPLLEIIASCH